MYVVANLGAEAVWRGEPLSTLATTRLAELAPLLAVLAAPGDDLVGAGTTTRATPEARGLLQQVTNVAAVPPETRGEALLAWSAAGVPARGGAAAGATWRERLRDAPRAPEAVARVVHGRRWLADERAAGTLPPHPTSTWVTNLGGLRRAAVGAGPWVLKAPHGAAGRDRVLSTAPVAGEATWRHAERALELWGGGLFETWLARDDDLGACGIVTEDAVLPGPMHRLVTGADGRFRGIERLAPAAAETPLARALRDVLPRVGARLQAAGYRGPFGVDAYAGRDAQGAPHRVAVGEVNARLTFGHLAACLFEVAAAGGRTLQRLVLRPALRTSLPPDAVPLVETVDGDEVKAWLEGNDAS
ncbi:MAG: hypothetical protein H6806_09000 [Planctomycetes bacterium]|nr:hypothetical protein [Planctomycetota bacterium]MCB9901951.1 hypothetical protein [Planctomycetota bacterium]